MAYARKRRPAPSRYRQRAGSRRGGRSEDAFAGVTIVQMMLTLIFVSVLYFSTLWEGAAADYVRANARAAFSPDWSAEQVLEAMAGMGEMRSFEEMADFLFFGQEESQAQDDAQDDDMGALGDAVFTQKPQLDLPTDPIDSGEDKEALDLPGFAAQGIPPAAGETSSDESADETDALGSGGMLVVDEGSFSPPDSVLTTPVYLSVRLKTPAAGKVTSPFGFRTHPITGRWDFHTGIDIAANTGTDVLAALQGTVAEVGTSPIYGKYIILDHGGGVSTGYSHCDQIIARKGQRVGLGARIATVGNTGISTGPHLHFELMVDGLKVDPLPHLRTAVIS